MNPQPKKSSRSRGPRSRAPRRSEPVEALHPTADPPDIKSFDHWDLGESIQGAIRGMGIESPTPIQALAIGPVLEGRDVIAKAETGTGKTLAFGAPMMARMDPQRSSVLALVLCPTRELSEQVFRVLEELGQASKLSVALIVGGEDMRPQVEALHAGAQVVVGTPGRVLDLMNQRFLSFPWTEFAVLDEADKMLEIGFIDDVRKILAAIPDERQTLLFSATFPQTLLSLARESTRNPAEIATAKGVATVDTIAQYFIKVDEDRRPSALSRLINSSEPDDIFLVFCERRTDVDRLLRWMERERFPVKALHGGYDQASRFRVMSAFRDGDVKALLATDVASRGLDVNHVTHVINFAVPRDISDYTHRIGRTGRAGRTGTAITMVTPGDYRNWSALLRGAPWTVQEIDTPDLSRLPSEEKAATEERDEPSRGDNERSPRARSAAGPESRPDERPERLRTERAPARRRETAGAEREERPAERGGRGGRGRGRDDSTRERGGEDRGARPQRRDSADRPAREGARREGSGSRERSTERPAAPARDSKPASRQPATSPKPAPGGFGSGIHEPVREKEKPPRQERKKPSEPKRPRREPAQPERGGDKGTGFGAGL